MYLNSVVQSLTSEKKSYVAEDLYQLNEAIFNLPEEDHIDKQLSGKIYRAAVKIQTAYTAGRYDQADPNFFYDYVALLATLQNQHFFSAKQHKAMLEWLHEAVSEKVGAGRPAAAPASSAPAPATAQVSKDLAKLEAENAMLRQHITKLKELTDAVGVLKTFKLPDLATDEPKGKGKGKGNGKAKRNGTKTKGQGKGKDTEQAAGASEAAKEEPKKEG